MPESLAAVSAARLASIRERDLFRQRRPLAGLSGGRAVHEGREYVVFCSNDYLGLAAHPEVVAAWRAAATRYGVGSGASQYITGYCPELAALEEELADALGRERALVFGAGYLANPGVIDALVGRQDEIFSDALNHASLIDGCRLSGARVQRYGHGDCANLESRLAAAGSGNRLVVSDAVFSMDGDRADLPGLAAVADRHQAWLMIDDAHGFGVHGPAGAGSVAQAALDQDQVPVLTVTLGKALGVYGACVAGRAELIEWLVQTCRSAIFTTAPPPALLAAARAGLRVMRADNWRRDHLAALIARLRDGLTAAGVELAPSSTPIQPVIVGDAARALAVSERLRERGYWVSAIRPPTVPAGTSRLRITLSAAHSFEQVDGLVAELAEALSLVGARAAVV